VFTFSLWTFEPRLPNLVLRLSSPHNNTQTRLIVIRYIRGAGNRGFRHEALTVDSIRKPHQLSRCGRRCTFGAFVFIPTFAVINCCEVWAVQVSAPRPFFFSSSSVSSARSPSRSCASALFTSWLYTRESLRALSLVRRSFASAPHSTPFKRPPRLASERKTPASERPHALIVVQSIDRSR